MTSELPDADAALAAHTRESLAALSPAELLDTAVALAAQCRALRSSLAAASASIYVLPDDLLSRVLHALPLVARVRCCAVSRRFRRLVDTDALRAALDPAHALVSGRPLAAGRSVNSPDGRYTLYYQHDANLVLYLRRPVDGTLLRPLWALQTVHVPYGQNAPGQLTLRRDGVVKVRNSRGETYWASPRPAGSAAPCRLVVRDQGDFAVVDANDAVVWVSAVEARPDAQ